MTLLPLGIAILVWVGWTVAQDYAAATGTPSERLLGAFQRRATLLYSRIGAFVLAAASIALSAAESLGAPGLTAFLSRWLTADVAIYVAALIMAFNAWLRTQNFGFEKPPEDGA